MAIIVVLCVVLQYTGLVLVTKVGHIVQSLTKQQECGLWANLKILSFVNGKEMRAEGKMEK